MMSAHASSPSSVVPFRFESSEIRTVSVNGDPWFVFRDICDALGLEHITNSLSKVPEQHLTVIRLQSGGQFREMKAIDESGMYRLVLRSDKPQAEPFIEWVTAEVLPTIRKTGSYSLDPSGQAQPASLVPLVDQFRAAKELSQLAGFSGNQAVLSANRAVKSVTGTDALQLLGATHLISETQKQYFTPTDLGKRKGSSGTWMNRQLESAGLQEKSRDAKGRIMWTPTGRGIGRIMWTPTGKGIKYSKLFDTGKKHRSGVPVHQVKWSEDVLALLDGFKEVAV